MTVFGLSLDVIPFLLGGGDRSEVGGRIGLGKDRTDEVEVENGR